jgi:hypothetical protein
VGNSVGSRRSGGERSGGERSRGELLMELKKPVVNKDGVCWRRKIIHDQKEGEVTLMMVVVDLLQLILIIP